MISRSLLGTAAALSFAAAPAAAQDVVPLAGKSENIQPIVRVKIPAINEVELAGDWAFASQDATEAGGVEQQGGLVIVNIADPTKPFIEGKWHADEGGLEGASYGDVDLSPDGNLAVLTNAHGSNSAGTATLIDVTDKAHPKWLSTIPYDDTMDYVHTANLDNNLLYLNPQVAAFYPQQGKAHITVFDISDRKNPKKIGTISSDTSEAGLAHDSYVDHRPDGKTILYGASIHKTDVFDVTKIDAPSWLQTTTSPEITISHDVQPNHDRKLLIIDDEGAAGGQLDATVSACGKVGGPGPAAYDSGSVHFYQAAEDGTFANGGLVELGSFNAPTNVANGACVAHVFWQAPNENRLTQAYYRTGAFVLDFEDPANPKSLGYFVPDGLGAFDANNGYWSNKPHRGYLFASAQNDGGLDILKYTGEGGTRWPATAGPAEEQRSKRQGVPYVPITVAGAPVATTPLPGPTAAPARDLGSFSFTAKAKKVPGKKGGKVTLTLTFANAKGKTVGAAKVKRAAGRKATVKVTGVAASGRYSWKLKAGKKVLAKGSFSVKKKSGLRLSPGATLAAAAR